MSCSPLLHTASLQRALARGDLGAGWRDELAYLERWERSPVGDLATLFRIRQLRRANAALAEGIRGDLARSRSRPEPG